MKPIFVTPLFAPLRLLKQSLPPLKDKLLGAEWWMVHCRYPLLGITDGISDTRGIQTLCHELGCEMYDVGYECSESEGLGKWACVISGRFPVSQPVIILPQDCELKLGALDLLSAEEKGCIRSKVYGASDIVICRMMDLMPGLELAKGKIVKGLSSSGGRISQGGKYSDDLWDEKFWKWFEAGKPGKLGDWKEPT